MRLTNFETISEFGQSSFGLDQEILMQSKIGGAPFRAVAMAMFFCLAGPLPLWSQAHAATLPAPAATKHKIESSLDKSDRNSLMVFDHEGNPVHQALVKPEALEKSSSLFDYVKTSDSKDLAANPFAKDKPAQCEDPKPVPNLPLCVLCKSGNHVCTKAKFTGYSHSQPPL